jgi:hypothetical protein
MYFFPDDSAPKTLTLNSVYFNKSITKDVCEYKIEI